VAERTSFAVTEFGFVLVPSPSASIPTVAGTIRVMITRIEFSSAR
jgi:hypothetical protein